MCVLYLYYKSILGAKMNIKNIFSRLGGIVRRVYRHRRKILSVLFTALSVFCGVYWLLCGTFAGFGISALWMWPLLAIFCGVLALWFGEKKPFRRLGTKRWLRIAVAVFLAVCFVYFVIIEGLVISGMSAKGQPELDYIIVLGAKVNGTVPSLALRCRIDRAYEYLRDNPDTVAIVSGGQGRGENISEAEAMRQGLVERGIDESRIILEARSTSTEENLEFSYELIEDSTTVGLVTNNFHVFRALSIAKNSHNDASGSVCGVSARYPNVLIIHYMMREFVSITFYALTGKF